MKERGWTLLTFLLVLLICSVCCATLEPSEAHPRPGCIITVNHAGNRVFERVTVVGEEDGQWVALLIDQHDRLKVKLPKEKVTFLGCYSPFDVGRKEMN